MRANIFKKFSSKLQFDSWFWWSLWSNDNFNHIIEKLSRARIVIIYYLQPSINKMRATKGTTSRVWRLSTVPWPKFTLSKLTSLLALSIILKTIRCIPRRRNCLQVSTLLIKINKRAFQLTQLTQQYMKKPIFSVQESKDKRVSIKSCLW